MYKVALLGFQEYLILPTNIRQHMVMPGWTLTLSFKKYLDDIIKAATKVSDESIIDPYERIIALPFKGSMPGVIKSEDFNKFGVLSKIVRYEKKSNNISTVSLYGMERMELVEIVRTAPNLVGKFKHTYLSRLSDPKVKGKYKALLRLIGNLIFMGALPREWDDYNFDKTLSAAYLLTSTNYFNYDERIEILNEDDASIILDKVIKRMALVFHSKKIEEEMMMKVEQDIANINRREVLLFQKDRLERQLGKKNVKEEDSDGYDAKINNAKMPEYASKIAKEQLNRLRFMQSGSPEIRVTKDYLDVLCSVPWSSATKDNLDIKKARDILDSEHYGLEKVKKRLIEEVAIRKLKPDRRGIIICLTGPPGVGKTSLGKSLARALGRKYERLSLGGVNDEHEIRGHRRTYIGALPGKILATFIKAGVKNPFIVLDEIDKLGKQAGRADVANSLLEVLDFEQNNQFVDHYLGIEFDISNAIFMCTANEINDIPSTLKDRLDIIELPGYTEQEKIQIAYKHLIKRQMLENGLDSWAIRFEDGLVNRVIRCYTDESGVRNLERRIADLFRSVAVEIASNMTPTLFITISDLPNILGPDFFEDEAKSRVSSVGLGRGLSVTAGGGKIILVECVSMLGKGNLLFTGKLGPIMKESMQVAFSVAQNYLFATGAWQDSFKDKDFHINFENMGVGKEGPSAGALTSLVLISSMLQLPIRADIAVTGEISLRGKILPVGGIKQKVLAAHRNSCKHVFLPIANKKDEKEIPESIRKDLEVHFVSHIKELVNFCIIVQ